MDEFGPVEAAIEESAALSEAYADLALNAGDDPEFWDYMDEETDRLFLESGWQW